MIDYYKLAAQFLVPVLGIMVVVLGWRIQRKTDRIKIIESQLSVLKSQAYSQVYSFFFDLLRDLKDKSKFNEKQARNDLFEVKKTILNYGSDEVIYQLSRWLSSTHEALHPSETIKLIADLLVAMRKDMGYPNTKITPDDILLYIMQDRSEFEKFKNGAPL